MTEYSRRAKGYFTSAGTAQTIYLPFQPNYVTWQDYTQANTGSANSTLVSGTWDINMGQGVNTLLAYNSSGVLIADSVTTNGVSSFGLFGPINAGLALQFGPQKQIASIGKASPTVITTLAAHGYSVGQVVILEGLFQSSTTGMPQMCGIPFVITAVGSTTTFTVLWNSNQSNYTALSGNPTGAFVRQVLNPNLYLPDVDFISAISTGASTTITTTTNHNYVVGQEIAFRIPALWGTTQLNSLPNNLIPGSPIYGFVTSVTSNTVFVCNFNSTGYTAFNSNQTVASVPGLSFPQVVAIGDINSGGWPYTGTVLYPSPQFPTSSGGVSTVNGPAVQGAFVNNTNQGFIIGAGVGTNSSAVNVGASSDVIYWAAYLFEYSTPT